MNFVCVLPKGRLYTWLKNNSRRLILHVTMAFPPAGKTTHWLGAFGYPTIVRSEFVRAQVEYGTARIEPLLKLKIYLCRYK